ncbi:MAG: ADP-ribosylglycohydrolase family protein [Acutalibacteraceae bacterium]
MAGWDTLENLLYAEVVQRGEEGCDVTGMRERVDACQGDLDKLMEVYGELSASEVDPGFPYQEPDELDAILSLSTAGHSEQVLPVDQTVLTNRMEGAWLGRCIGCAMGKPFETGPYVNGNDKGGGFIHIKRWLEGADAYPLNGYTPGVSRAAADGLSVICPDSQKEQIAFMETDDDIRYLVIGLLIAEQYGNDFTPDNVAGIWQTYLPAFQCCTAERQAYINSLNAEIQDEAARWEYYRRYLNPYREWIGAQIRVDQYGYVNAGYPLTAAKTAFRDARFTHVKNGVYGAMFTAAVIAAAFSESDPVRCVEAGLAVIPATSRLYADIRKAMDIARSTETQEELFSRLWAAFGQYNWVHTNNNAAACAAALVFGKGNFTATLSAAVSCGWDTDCNGATIGSVMGALHGAAALPEELKAPLHDTLYSFIPGFHPIAISECARRSLAVYHKLHP